MLALALAAFLPAAAAAVVRRGTAECTPFSTTFPDGSVAPAGYASADTPFIGISPSGSYTVGDGLQLYLTRPVGDVKTADGVNDKLGSGATVNSTFELLYGSVTYEVASPSVPGIVTAAILIADELDEMDIELLGGDLNHWQSNVYAPSPADTQPLWGVFGDIHDFPTAGDSVVETHNYTIDWSAERIVWKLDGEQVRSFTPADAVKNGTVHYPSHAARLQMGIWDASSPKGTAAWADGPVNWANAPATVKAVIKSVTVECPDSA